MRCPNLTSRIQQIPSLRKEKIQHAVREATRLFRWKGAGGCKTRKSLQGIATGVNKAATLSQLEQSRRRSKGCLTPYEAGTLRSIIVDTSMPRARQHKRQMVETPTCPYCTENVPEDHEHMWFGCSGSSPIREPFADIMALDRTEWPYCLRRCAILPKGLENLCPPAKLGRLQRMMAGIELHRHRMDRARQIEGSSGEGVP